MLAYYLTLLEEPDDSPLFCEIYERYNAMVYGLAFHILRSQHDAEDVAQSAWERVARKFDTAKNYYLNSRSVFKPWLVVITRNLAITELGRRKRTVEMPEDWDAPSNEDVEGKNSLRELMDLIHSMPEKSRLVLELRLISECSFSEMGKAIGCSEDAARMRYGRALDTLKDRLWEGGYEYGKEPV